MITACRGPQPLCPLPALGGGPPHFTRRRNAHFIMRLNNFPAGQSRASGGSLGHAGVRSLRSHPAGRGGGALLPHCQPSWGAEDCGARRGPWEGGMEWLPVHGQLLIVWETRCWDQ